MKACYLTSLVRAVHVDHGQSSRSRRQAQCSCDDAHAYALNPLSTTPPHFRLDLPRLHIVSRCVSESIAQPKVGVISIASLLWSLTLYEEQRRLKYLTTEDLISTSQVSY